MAQSRTTKRPTTSQSSRLAELLSEPLSADQLNELDDVLIETSPAQFIKTDPGMRSRIYQNCYDATRSSDQEIANAGHLVLSTLMIVGVQLPAAEYAWIVIVALAQAFESSEGNRDDTIHDLGVDICTAAAHVAAENVHVMAEALRHHLATPRAYPDPERTLEVLQHVVDALIENPACPKEDAAELKQIAVSVMRLEAHMSIT